MQYLILYLVLQEKKNEIKCIIILSNENNSSPKNIFFIIIKVTFDYEKSFI